MAYMFYKQAALLKQANYNGLFDHCIHHHFRSIHLHRKASFSGFYRCNTMSYVSTDIKKIIAEIIENKKEKGGVKNIYFVGCGGSLGALYPAKTFMEREAQVLRSAWINSNEFVHSTPKDFGENSIICLACHKGNTPETIQAAKLGKEKDRSR